MKEFKSTVFALIINEKLEFLYFQRRYVFLVVLEWINTISILCRLK